jgi:tetratricopeptide (TPR) repeat protein
MQLVREVSVKSLFLITTLLLASASSVFATDANVCRQLLISPLPDEGPADAPAFFDDAEKAYRDCRSAKLPVDVRVKVLTKYGRAQYVRGQTQAAIQAYREALEILDSAPGDQTQLLLEVLDRAVSAETDARLRSDAIAHASRALSLRQAKFGDASLEAIKAMVLLGAVHATFGDWDKWESLLRTAIRIAEKTCGPECDARAEAYSGMAAFYGSRGNEAEAKKYEEMALNATPPSRKRASQGKD